MEARLDEIFVKRFIQCDYSWDGLKRKRADGWRVQPNGALTPGTGEGRPATLQDFWADEQTRLVETEYGTFTRWHLPPGTAGAERPDDYQIHEKVEQSIRLLAAAGKPVSRIPFEGVGFAADVDFVSVIEQCARNEVDINLWEAFVEGAVQFEGFLDRRFSIDRMCFFQEVEFRHCRFEKMYIQFCFFCEDLSFENMEVTGECSLMNTAISKCLSCFDSTFSSVVYFTDMTVGDHLRIQKCRFVSDLPFSLNRSRIHSLTLEFSHVSELSFDHCRFNGTVRMRENEIRKISGRSIYSSGEFYLEKFDILRAAFTDSTFEGNFHLSGSLKIGDLEASSAKFLGRADFGKIETNNACFARAIFDGAVSFRGVSFSGPVDFEQAVWPRHAEHFLEAFRDARFFDATNFSTDSFHIVAAFNEAHFTRAPLVLLNEGKAGDASFERMLAEADHAARRTAEGDPQADLVHAKERFFAALEGGARVLKQAMETRRSRQLEHRFYRYELLARRHRPSISSWERAVSSFYGAVSNYGDSSLRPLLIFLASTVLMGLVYGGWAALLGGTVSWDIVEDGLIFSGRSVFRPFEVWSGRSPTGSSALESLLMEATAPGPLLVRLCSSIQSFLAIVLTFLIGLSLKRRFQLG